MQSGSAKSICQKNGEILMSTQIVHVVFLHLASQQTTEKVLQLSIGVKTRKQYEQVIKVAVLITELSQITFASVSKTSTNV